jgi:hypothetical protein
VGALEQLKRQFESEGVHADPLRLGAAFLALARSKNWDQHPEALTEWLGDLAIDVANGWHNAQRLEAEIDTIPIAELRKIRQSLRPNEPPSEDSGVQ